MVETFNFGNHSNRLSHLFHTNSNHVACGRSLPRTLWVCHTTLKAFSLPWNEWQTRKELWNELMFSHRCSELAMGISIERPMLSGMHLVFPSRLVVVLLQFVIFVTWVVDHLSRVSRKACYTMSCDFGAFSWLFSALASEACYLLGGSGDCWRRAASGSFYRSSSSWWWCWWCREWFGGCAW